jgi:hypothetical protein
MKPTLYRLNEEARDFFLPSHAVEFFRIVDSRTKGRRTIRAVALRADGSEEWLDTITFEVHCDELEAVA